MRPHLKMRAATNLGLHLLSFRGCRAERAGETTFSNHRSPSMETPHPEPQRTPRRAKAHLECPSSLRCRSQGPSQGSPNGSWQTNAPPRSPDLDRTPSRRAMSARQRFRRRFLRNHPKARGHVPTRTDCDCLAAHRERPYLGPPPCQRLPSGLRRAPARFYLRHAPTLRHFNHLADLARHRTPLRPP